jgi:hypothetical protein
MPVAPPRLPDSPFPASSTPTSITVFNLTGASFGVRLLALSAVGIIAQRCPELATVDQADAHASLSSWHLELLRMQHGVRLDYSLQHNLSMVLGRFRADLSAGFIFAGSDGGPGSDNGARHVAVSLAGVLRAVVATSSVRALVQAAGLQMAFDATSTTLEATFASHRDHFSQTMLFNQQHEKLTYTTDLAVYSKAFALYDATLTMPLAQAALQRLRPIAMVLGWASEVHPHSRQGIILLGPPLQPRTVLH